MTGSPPPTLAVTTGEPAGIGPEVILKAWDELRRSPGPRFYVLSDPEFMAARARALGLPEAVHVSQPDEAVGRFADALPVVPLAASLNAKPGVPSGANARGVVESIRRAVEDVRGGRASAVVTAPIHKKALYDAGFDHPGHTEYLGALTGELGGQAEPVMMLAGPELRVVPVTVHIPLADVPSTLTSDLIVTTGRTVAADLRSRFGIAAPRLAVAGLNPHAGEDGAMGVEDIDIIAPAVAELRAESIDARGPLPADTMFHTQARGTYDAALCMYHDQALIPVKALDFARTVNVTLGLPFVRTSPDHGTAFDIAGSGEADPTSMIAAIILAAELASTGDGSWRD